MRLLGTINLEKAKEKTIMTSPGMAAGPGRLGTSYDDQNHTNPVLIRCFTNHNPYDTPT